MGFIWLRGRADLRAKWRAVVILVLLVGIGGGGALTALAGARRADTAISRFVAYSRPSTGVVFFGDSPFAPPPVKGPAAYSETPPPYARAVLDLPQVETYFRKLYLFLVASGPNGGRANTFATPDASLFRSADRSLVVAGHLPDPGDPFAITV
ncbi:MAG: hypothetical protein ACRDXE_02025, partial [Acidimicrobiales bacterium]